MANKKHIEHIFKAHYGNLLRMAAAILHDKEIARDIVQDVFVTLLGSNSLQHVSDGYLYKAVRNRALNHIRNLEIHQKITEGFFVENKEGYETEIWPDEETFRMIDRLISSSISQQARQIIEMRFKEGILFSEIAIQLGISENAVYRHLRNALALIRKNIKNYV